jgi:glycosyltransferase involved in cell wall biosynthesis
MRVLIVQHGIFPGFVAPVAKECAKNLSQLGIAVEVAAIGKRSQQVAAEPLGFPIHSIDSSSTFHIYSELRRLINDGDVVHYFLGKGLELLPLLNRRAKYVFHHISVSVSGNKSRDNLINFGKRLQPFFADLALFTDAELAETLRPVRSIPIELMPVGYADDLFFPCPPDDQPVLDQSSEKDLVYHGAVRHQRRLNQLVEVLARLPREFTLTIIGGGSPSDEEYRGHLAALGKRLNCDDRLNLTNMPQAQIRSVIAKAYMGLSYVPMLECFQDQFVLKTLEYLACHRPVLATATRYTKHFSQSIGDGRILLADDDVDDMVNKIVGAADYVKAFYSPQNLDSLSDVLAPYTTRHLVQTRLLPIYEKLVNH